MNKVMRAAMSMSVVIACLAGCSSDAPAPNASASDSAATQVVAANAVSLRTIEPGGADFSDLDAFGRAVGDRPIVILGEPTHGDGDIFKLKTRLVQYLHEAKGFDVLIIESGMFDMARIRERHTADGTSYSALSPGRMFFMYSRTEDGQRVLNYVDSTQATPRPLALTGFDISMGGDSSARELVPMLQRTLTTRGSSIAASTDWATYVGIANQVVALNNTPRPDATQLAAFKRVTAALDGELCATPQADDFNFTRSPSFWCRIVRSVDAGQERLWGPIDLRDRTDGDNVKWLLDHPFAGKKVVLWMHSFHGINGQAFPPSGPTWISVGTRLGQIYGDQVFMTHFTAGRGSFDAYASTGSPPTLPALRSGMIEQALATRNAPQFLAYPTDAPARDALRGLTAFEPDFGSVSPNHFGSGYQGLFFIPQTRAILPEPDRYPLIP